MTNPDQLANLADILRALTIAAVARNAYRDEASRYLDIK
jgi:hypothetical protein